MRKENQLQADVFDNNTISEEFLLFEKIISDRGSKYSVSGGQVNNQEDIAAYINKVMAEKKVNMENTIEWMIWETILEGKFSYEGIEYDYSPSATQYITLAGGGNDWDYKKGDWCEVQNEKYRSFIEKHEKKLYKFRYFFKIKKK